MWEQKPNGIEKKIEMQNTSLKLSIKLETSHEKVLNVTNHQENANQTHD